MEWCGGMPLRLTYEIANTMLTNLRKCEFTVFKIIGRAKRAPHWGVQSRFRVIYIYMLSVCCMSVVCQINCLGGITWPTRMLKVF